MKGTVLLLIALAFFALAGAKHEEYIRSKTYKISAKTNEQFDALVKSFGEYYTDVWQHPSLQRKDAYVMVSPEYQTDYENFLKSWDIEYSIFIDDVKTAFDNDDEMVERANKNKIPGRITFDAYYRIAEINEYLDNLAAQYPDRVTLVNAGESFEGRTIKYLKISSNGFQDPNKPAIFMEAAIHAREWVAPPAALYSIYKLVEDITESDLADNIDWIILPVANPDGYEFTHTNSRTWRKTRSTVHSGSFLCPGVDGNRNFDISWNSPLGSSGVACMETYRGPSPFSEPETIIMRQIMHDNVDKLSMYISIHSYGSYILYPWSNNGSLPAHGLELHTMAISAIEAIESVSPPTFPKWVAGNAASALGYRASGSSADYALDIGIHYSFIFELPGFGSGVNGFVTSPDLLPQIVFETWEGIKVLARAIL